MACAWQQPDLSLDIGDDDADQPVTVVLHLCTAPGNNGGVGFSHNGPLELAEQVVRGDHLQAVVPLFVGLGLSVNGMRHRRGYRQLPYIIQRLLICITQQQLCKSQL